MALLAEANALALLLKILTIAALVVAGIRYLWQAHVDRSPRLAAARAARIPAYVSPYAKSLPQQPVTARLTPGKELQRLTSVLDLAQTRVQAINRAQVAAARQIDSAEVALNRLLSEIAGVMPTVMKTPMVPRRTISTEIEMRQAMAA
jgi:hypothetical protein